MNSLINALSGLRVLCGETITNCLPIHKIFASATGQEEDEEEQKHNGEGGGYETSVQRENNQYQAENSNQKVKLPEEWDVAKQPLKNNTDQDVFDSKFTSSTSSSADTNQFTFESLQQQEEKELPQVQEEITPPPQQVQQQQQKPKKQMIGMIDEDKVQKVEKKEEEDEVDYFSEMNMGNDPVNFKTPAVKAVVVKKQEEDEKKIQENESNEPSIKFDNEVHDHEEMGEGAGWGHDENDFDL